MKLFPIFATSFAYIFTMDYINEKYQELLAGIKKGDSSLLTLLHHYSSGLKAIMT